MSLAELAELVDGSAGSPMIVLGSWPPSGRDLDLLAVQRDERLGERLTTEGFERSGQLWVRFRGCGADVIDIAHVDDWGLPSTEAEALFDEATPVEGMHRLLEPAPHHALLILARRVGERRVTLSDRRRERIVAALTNDPDAWTEAFRRATAWGSARALENLRILHDGGVVTRWSGIAARSERGDPAYVEASRAIAKKSRSLRGTLITFSGIDGSGKTTQIDHLGRTLESLGLESVRVWNRLAVNPSLNVIAIPVKRLLGLFRRGTTGGAEKVAKTADPKRDDPVRQLRSDSNVLTFGWTLIVALWNAISQRRATQRHLIRGRVVLCDRYTFDSAVNLRYLYGESRDFTWQERLIRAVSPRPALSIFVDTSPATAHARKPIKYQVEDLERFARLYREVQGRFGVVRIDGDLSEEEVCSEIARVVWDRIRRSRA